MAVPLLLPMVLLSPTAVLRWGQRSSTTVMRATPPESGGHHSARRMDHGYLTQHYLVVCLVSYNKAFEKRIILCVYISVECGIPNITMNVNLTVDTTTYNSTATYTCGTGYVSSEVYITVCTEHGEWEPDPNALECREPGMHVPFSKLWQLSLSYVIL